MLRIAVRPGVHQCSLVVWTWISFDAALMQSCRQGVRVTNPSASLVVWITGVSMCSERISGRRSFRSVQFVR